MNRPFYGWVLVAYAVLCGMTLTGTTQAVFGLYVVPVSKELGLSRADMNLAIIFMNLGAAIFAPIAGWLADRISLRLMMTVGGFIVTGSFLALGMSTSALFSGIIVGLVLTAGSSAVGRPESVLIVRWFDARRGRALTIGAMGLSLAGIVISPLVGQLIGNFGWRTSLMISGLFAGSVILVPLLFLRTVPSPAERAFEASAATANAPPPSGKPIAIAALLRMPQFWWIGVAIAIPMSVSQAVQISLAPMAVEAGIPVAQAATLVSFAGLMAITGKFGLAVIADKVNQMVLMATMFFIGALENLLLFLVAGQKSFWVLVICALMQGLSSGMLMPLFTALVARRFGAVSFGTVVGMIFPIISICNALLARYAGEVYDRTGSYKFAFASFVVMELAAAAMILSARRFPLPQMGDGSEPGNEGPVPLEAAAAARF